MHQRTNRARAANQTPSRRGAWLAGATLIALALLAPTFSTLAARFPSGAPSMSQVGKYLVISMGDDADVGRAFQMSDTELGADRKVLSIAQDPGYITDGSFP